jgi:FkbM family methyltransferase
MKAFIKAIHRCGAGLLNAAVSRRGYELRKTKTYTVDGTRIGEIDGLSFQDFLECYFSAASGPDFYFVQVGAHDGLSNAYDELRNHVIRFNLQGLLVEPQPGPFQALRENYTGQPGINFENAAVGLQDGMQQLYTIRDDVSLNFLTYVNQAASFDRGLLRKLLTRHLQREATPEVIRLFREAKRSVNECIEAVPVRTLTFETLLQKHSVRHIDLLQIDTEGFDYEVIKMANLEERRPTLVNYEHEHLRDRDRLECWRDLKSLGYRLFTHGGDTCAYRRDWGKVSREPHPQRPEPLRVMVCDPVTDTNVLRR